MSSSLCSYLVEGTVMVGTARCARVGDVMRLILKEIPEIRRLQSSKISSVVGDQCIGRAHVDTQANA